MKKYFPVLLFLLSLQSCSSGIVCTYNAGGYSFRFEKGGKVYMSAMGVESDAPYEKDGNKIKITGRNGQNMILTMTNEATI